MNDRSRLDDKLAKLGQAEMWPDITGASTQEIFRAILMAIDEAVLPRDIAIRNDDKELVFQASKRRLLAISGALETEIDESDPISLSLLADQIPGALGTLGKLELVARRPETEPDPSAVGASVEALSAAWGIDPYAPAGGYDNLIAAMSESAIARVIWSEGEKPKAFGEPGALMRIYEEIAEDRAALKAAGGAETGLLALGVGEEEPSIVFAWSDEEEAALVLPGSLFARALRIWRG